MGKYFKTTNVNYKKHFKNNVKNSNTNGSVLGNICDHLKHNSIVASSTIVPNNLQYTKGRDIIKSGIQSRSEKFNFDLFILNVDRLVQCQCCGREFQGVAHPFEVFHWINMPLGHLCAKLL